MLGARRLSLFRPFCACRDRMSPQPRPARIILSLPLTSYDLGIAFCDLCQRPSYSRLLYGRDRVLRQEAHIRTVTIGRRMYVARGDEREWRICGPCLWRRALRKAR
jgi:hypothetical protein